jgi:hypothetical protein
MSQISTLKDAVEECKTREQAHKRLLTESQRKSAKIKDLQLQLSYYTTEQSERNENMPL